MVKNYENQLGTKVLKVNIGAKHLRSSKSDVSRGRMGRRPSHGKGWGTEQVDVRGEGEEKIKKRGKSRLGIYFSHSSVYEAPGVILLSAVSISEAQPQCLSLLHQQKCAQEDHNSNGTYSL